MGSINDTFCGVIGMKVGQVVAREAFWLPNERFFRILSLHVQRPGKTWFFTSLSRVCIINFSKMRRSLTDLHCNMLFPLHEG